MEKFRTFASEYGEFINYEHDRGARDIGMHLTRKLSSGKEQLTNLPGVRELLRKDAERQVENETPSQSCSG